MGSQPGGRGHPFLARRIARSPEYRRRLETAERLGISPSIFAGKELRSTTEFFRDDDGYLIRTVTTHESAWTEHDQAEMLALAEYRAGLCPGCGLPKDQAWAPEQMISPFLVEKHMCQAERVLIDARKPFTDQKAMQKHPEYAAYHWGISVKPK